MDEEDDWEPYNYHGRRRRRGLNKSSLELSSNSSLLSLGRPLIDAILKNDILYAQGIVMAKADVNQERDEVGRAALHIASSFGIAGLARMITQNSADLAAQVHGGVPLTALHLAAQHGHNAVMRVLLDARADPDGAAGIEPPLCRCAGDGNLEGMSLLLKARAQVDVHDPGAGHMEASPVAFSALLRAVERNADRQIVQELIQAAANLAALDMDFNQPLHLAVRKGNLRAVRCLLEARADPNSFNQSLTTPLHIAVSRGEPRTINLLSKFNGDFSLQDGCGSTPVEMAEHPMTKHLLSNLAGQVAVKQPSRPSSRSSLRPSSGRRRLSMEQLLDKSAGSVARGCLAAERFPSFKALQAPASGPPTRPASPASSTAGTGSTRRSLPAPSMPAWHDRTSAGRLGSLRVPPVAWN